jgi:DNA mismatch endonuclease Vsr
MSDIFSISKRSELMSHVSGKETKLEMQVRQFLFSKGFRFRKNVKSLPGTPDIVLTKYKTIIFVHGCFWHGHEGCRKAHLPSTNVEFWQTKIERNKERDRRKIEELESLGWKVIIVWQCELKNKSDQEARMNLLRNQIVNA